MYWLLCFYMGIFSVLLLFNAWAWLANRGNPLILLYELGTGAYLVFLVALYNFPALLAEVTVWTLLPVPLVLLLECHFSVTGRMETYIPGKEQFKRGELEAAQAFSLLFSSPAYIIGAKLFIDRIL